MKDNLDNILVIKVGTSTLVKKDKNGSEQLDDESFKRISRQIMDLRNQGFKIVLVSSAAITAGILELGLGSSYKSHADMPQLQRLASIGWRHVLNKWSDGLNGMHIGEVLITQNELDIKDEREELLRVVYSLLTHGDIAVLNENDAIAHREITFGDNDILAAMFAAKLSKSSLFGSSVKLLLLSDVEGVKSSDGKAIARISNIDKYVHLALGSGSSHGSGGMKSKFEAARICKLSDVEMWVVNGRLENVINRALAMDSGTHFC